MNNINYYNNCVIANKRIDKDNTERVFEITMMNILLFSVTTQVMMMSNQLLICL